MKTKILTTIGLAMLAAWSMVCPGSTALAQDIGWGPAIGITGDANLASGVYYDGFLPNTTAPSPLTVDGLTFNVDTIVSSTSSSDGIITVTANSGSLLDYSSGSSFPSAAPSSPDFAAVINAGGIYQDGGAGTGTVTISGLTPGQNYEVQVFNYANDGDPGLTTFSGTNTVTLSNLAGAGGPNTAGEFASGTFTASSDTETFNWTGAGSAYTVVGAIYVCTVPSDLPPTISVDTTPNSVTTYVNSITTFTAIFSGTPPMTNQWYASTDNGVTFDEIAGATNTTLTLTNTEVVTNVEYYLMAVNAYGTNHSTPATLTVQATPPQTIAWGSAAGISGDNSLLTNGVYVDAFILNTGLAAGLSADGVTFNAATSSSSSGGSDGLITFDILSGNNNSYNFTSFPTNPPSSPAFAAVMNAGGTYQNGGAGSGIVTLGGLTVGHYYSVQVFNFADDGDQGLTTLSGTTPVTLNNLPGAGGINTYGEYATGIFTATATNESFYWNGAGSGYTVLGAISVLDITSQLGPILTQDTTPASVTAYLNSTATFTASFIGPQPITNQWWESTDGGTTFAVVPGATNTTLILTNSLLVTNVEYYLEAANAYGTNHSTAATLTVVPSPDQSINWEGVAGITGDANLSTNGTYFDALLPNTSATGPLTADGITFNQVTNNGSGFGDGFISFTASGLNNYEFPNTFPTTGGASSAFAAVMGSGGVYQNGGNGTGIVLLSGLTPGHVYSVQVFNYAEDNDPGLTTLSGSPSATLSNLPGAGGPNTYGEYATGSFSATGTSELFNWQGAGSTFTVLGAISIRDITGVVATNAISLQSSFSNGAMQLNWPPDHTGWRLQMQAEPLNVGLENNWVDVSGSTGVNSVNLPISSTNGCVFFRLVYP